MRRRALLLHGGTIHTGNPAQPRAEAVLAIGERIAYVGDEATARARAPAGTRVVDLSGRTVLPGLSDAHAHLADIGERELGFDLTGVESVDALKRRLARARGERRVAVDRRRELDRVEVEAGGLPVAPGPRRRRQRPAGRPRSASMDMRSS